MSNDPYDVLGVPRTASAIEIHAAYRRLSAELRPDGFRGSDETEARFREVDAAYEILSDAKRRSEYDQSGVIPPPTEIPVRLERRATSGAAPVSETTVAERRHDDSLSESVFFLVIAGLAFIYYGFFDSTVGISGDPIYDNSIEAFHWMSRVVGIGLLLVAGAAVARLPFARTLDLVVSSIAAFGCLAIAAIWFINGDGQWILLLLLALVNGWSAKAAWQARAAA